MVSLQKECTQLVLTIRTNFFSIRELNFTAKTEGSDLKLFFGDHSSHAGNFVFQSGITGTLTKGRPTLTHAIPFKTITKTHLLQIAIAVEALSDHPLASAIVEGGKKELGNIDIPKAENLKVLIARGSFGNSRYSIDG